MHLSSRKRTESLWLYAVAGALMVGGPVWRELYVNHYPARVETFVLPLLAGAIGAVVASGSWFAGGLLGTAVFGGLLMVFADFQLHLDRYTYTAVVLAGSLLVALVLRLHRAAIVSLALGAFYLSSLLRPSSGPKLGESADPAAGSPLLLVHIVLDEQWGVGGLRAAGEAATADFLTDFYLKRGFELYPSAYSRYDLTSESIPALLSLGEDHADSREKVGPGRHRMVRNPYFERLRELQYNIRVTQTTFLDYCSRDPLVLQCEEQQGNSIRNFAFFEGSWVTRGIFAARFFLNTRSHLYDRLAHEGTFWRRSVTGGGLAAMQRLTESIAAHPSAGTAFFVHVLLPHGPVQADAECRLMTDAAEHHGPEHRKQTSDSAWRAILRYSNGQIRCAHRVLARVIDAIDNTVGRENSIVIVHGDHGSRLHPTKLASYSLQAFTADELNREYATLLAVRRPNVAAAVHLEPIPVQDAIWELARTEFVGPLPTSWEHYLRSHSSDSSARPVDRRLVAREMLWAR